MLPQEFFISGVAFFYSDTVTKVRVVRVYQVVLSPLQLVPIGRPEKNFHHVAGNTD